jgi:hypothetical protein
MTPAINHNKAFNKLKAKLQVIYDLPAIGEKESEDMLRLEQVLKTYSRLYTLSGPVQPELIPCDGCKTLIPLVRPGQWAFCQKCTSELDRQEGRMGEV